MNRRALPLLAIGVVAIVAAAVWAGLGGRPLMPSYLAAWLVWAGVPLGALLVLLMAEVGGSRMALAPVAMMQGLALGVPLAALAFVPVLVKLPTLYQWLPGAGPGAPFGDHWLRPGFFLTRAIVFVLLLSALAVMFGLVGSPGRRRGAALLGLFVFALVSTLAAYDWVMSLDPNLHSSEFGVLLMSSQAATAVAAAILLLSVAGVPMFRSAAFLLAATSAIWLSLQFFQFLIMWSADLPKEVAWYLMRDADAGRTMEWFGFLGGFVLPVALLVLPDRPMLRLLPLAALAVLFAHMAEALWFVTPVFRHHFSLRATDILLLVGFGGIAAGIAWLWPPRAPSPAASGHEGAI